MFQVVVFFKKILIVKTFFILSIYRQAGAGACGSNTLWRSRGRR